LGEGRAGALQVGVEAFNILNYSNALRVSPFFLSGAGQLSSYGEPLETLNARQIQLVVQFEYQTHYRSFRTFIPF